MSEISVVLPEPVLPMMAVVSPGRARKLMSCSYRGLGTGIAVLDASHRDTRFGRPR